MKHYILGGLLFFCLTRSNTQHLADPIPEVVQESDLVVFLETFSTIPSGQGYSNARVNMIREVPDASGRTAVIDLNGFLYMVNDQGVYQEYIDFNTEFPDFKSSPGLGTGSGAMAFHPEFATNGILYTSHAENAGSATADFSPIEGGVALQWVVERWVAVDPAANTFSGTHAEILRVDFTGTIHGMQDITFNPFAGPGDADYGKLFICHGDGASSENGLFANVGTAESYLSAILRIDPEGNNSANGKYGIPADNPYVGQSGAVGEIWAFGFRNPHRLSFELRSGDTLLFVGDIGHHKIEEINLVEKGGNYGWDRREGAFLHDRDDTGRGVLSLDGVTDTVPYIYPVVQYDHDEGRAIALGHTWTSDLDPDLKGTMFFGDIPSGTLFHVSLDSLIQGKQASISKGKISIDGGAETTFPEYHNNGRVDLRFSRNGEGQLFMFTKIDGKIYKCLNSNKLSPKARFTMDDDGGHAPFSVSVDASASTALGTINYFWDFGDSTTSDQAQVEHTYSTPGVYSIKLTVYDDADTSSVITKEVVVYERPKAIVLSSVTGGYAPLTVIFEGRTSSVDEYGEIGYSWDFGDGGTSTKGYAVHEYSQQSLYQAILTIEDGLGADDKDTVLINVSSLPLGIPLEKLQGFSIYPNPYTDYLTVESGKKASVILLDMSGTTLKKFDIQEGKQTLDMKFIQNGTYLLQVSDEQTGNIYHKIIIKQ